jgi:GNAT superfamily N-acetyltransferase
MEYRVDGKTIIRSAQEQETGVILDFIQQLALYEGMTDQVTATEELLRKTIFQDHKAEVLLCIHDDQPVGFAVFFHNFSTFLGKPGLYLEDLFVKPNMRTKGFGKSLITALGKIAVERDCGRLEWSCLDWNRKSIDFYLGLGAQSMTEWTVYRITGQKLIDMAAQEF